MDVLDATLRLCGREPLSALSSDCVTVLPRQMRRMINCICFTRTRSNPHGYMCATTQDLSNKLLSPRPCGVLDTYNCRVCG